jgi:hypothetical protein
MVNFGSYSESQRESRAGGGPLNDGTGLRGIACVTGGLSSDERVECELELEPV